MKGLLKNLGLILVVIGAVILVACSFTGNVNNNASWAVLRFGCSGIDFLHCHQQENCRLISKEKK